MLDEPLRILIAAAICWINFMTVDLIFKLPHRGGVSGATAIAQEIEKGGGNRNGGFMMGNAGPVPLTFQVAPGQSANLSVTLTAPTAAGTTPT